MIKEIWKDVKGYEGIYRISDLGRVKSLDRYIKYKTHKQFKKGKEIKILVKGNDSFVRIYKNKKCKFELLKEIVAITFIKNPNNYNMLIHIDGERKNCSVNNLMWIESNIINQKNEVWKNIKGHKTYSISNLGRVKSKIKIVNVFEERLIKPFNDKGYLRISFAPKHKKYFLHRLIAIYFILNPKNKLYINHIDGNSLNNKIKNLEWCTTKENSVHAHRIGLCKIGEECSFSKLTESEAKEIFKSNKKQKDLAEAYGVSRSTVCAIKTNRNWKHININIEELYSETI